jgi:hypothetical protein
VRSSASRAGEAVAVHALVVDAKNDRAKAFYERYGFVAFVDAPNRLYLPLYTVLTTRPETRHPPLENTP